MVWYKTLIYRINIIAASIISCFFLAVGGAAVWLVYAFKQEVYVYLVVVGADLLLVIFAIVFITTGVRAYIRNRASHEYEYLRDLFKNDSETKYLKLSVKVVLKIGWKWRGLLLC